MNETDRSTRFPLGDCHTHLDKYAPDEMPGIIQRAQEAGVGYIVTAGTTLDSSRACIQMTKDYDIMYAGVGIHPMEANEPVDDKVYATLEELAKSSPKVICISEVGLDFLPASPDHAIQYQVFRQHIRLAKSLRLPIIFHSRESHPQVFQTLREEQAGDVGGGKGLCFRRVGHHLKPLVAPGSIEAHLDRIGAQYRVRGVKVP